MRNIPMIETGRPSGRKLWLNDLSEQRQNERAAASSSYHPHHPHHIIIASATGGTNEQHETVRHRSHELPGLPRQPSRQPGQQSFELKGPTSGRQVDWRNTNELQCGSSLAGILAPELFKNMSMYVIPSQHNSIVASPVLTAEGEGLAHTNTGNSRFFLTVLEVVTWYSP